MLFRLGLEVVGTHTRSCMNGSFKEEPCAIGPDRIGWKGKQNGITWQIVIDGAITESTIIIGDMYDEIRDIIKGT